MISGAVAGVDDSGGGTRQAGEGNSNKGDRTRAEATPTVWLWVFGSPIVRAQLAVTMILVGLVTVMTVWIWHYTTTTQMDETERMAVPQRLQLLLLTREKLLGLLRQSAMMNLAIVQTFHSNRFGTNSGDFATVNSQALEVLLPVLKSNEQISAIALLLSNGFSVGISRVKGVLLRTYIDRSGNYTWWTSLIDLETGMDVARGPIVGQGDFRELEVMKDLSKGPDLYTLMSVANIDLVTTLTISTKIGSGGFNGPPPEHGFHGMVTAFIELDAIGAFMSELDLLGGKMYVSESKGRLVAVSDGSPAYAQEDNHQEIIMERKTKVSEMEENMHVWRCLEKKRHTRLCAAVLGKEAT